MKNAPLWPVASALALLILGSAVVEVSARHRNAEVITVKIVDNEIETGDDEPDDWSESASEALSEEHLFARQLAKRRDFDQAVEIYQRLLADHQNGSADNPQLLTEYARLLARSGKPGEAQDYLIRARDAAPDDARIAAELGFVLRRQGDNQGAERELRRSLEMRPNHSRTRIALGDLLRRDGKLQEAVAVLEPAAQSGSNEERARALTVLGRCQMALKDRPQARRLLREAVERAPASVNTWLAATYAYLDSEDPSDLDRALEHALRVSRLIPDAGLAHRLLGRIHERRNGVADAMLAYKHSLSLEPKSEIGRERLLRLALDNDELKLAQEQAKALLRLAPSDPQYHFLAGLVEARAERHQPAIEYYLSAIELKGGKYPEAWFNLGKVYVQAKQFDDAVAAYLEAIREKQKYAAAWNNLGRAYVDKNEPDEAQNAFEQAIQISPDYSLAWHNLARHHYKHQRYAEASQAYERACQLAPDDRSLRLKYAIALRKAGNPDQAIATYRKILDQNPRYVTAWFNLGVALNAADRPDEAKEAYEKALSLDPEHAGALKNLGYVEARAGHTKQALAYLNDALDHEPGDEETRLKLAELHLADANRDACRSEVERVLANNDKNPSAQAMLARCGQ